MALGAQPGAVLTLILKEMMWMIGVGFMIGIPVAMTASRWAGSLVFGIDRNDPFTFLFGFVRFNIGSNVGGLSARSPRFAH
jgi:hypothetical protein